MYNCIPNNYSGNKSHYSTQWSVASFIQGVFHLPSLWLKRSNCEKHKCLIMPRNQAELRGRKENGFQLILVDASFKKREITQSSLLPEHPAGATFHKVTKHSAGSGITTLLTHQCHPSLSLLCHTSPRLLSQTAQDSLRGCMSPHRVTAVVHILIEPGFGAVLLPAQHHKHNEVYFSVQWMGFERHGSQFLSLSALRNCSSFHFRVSLA